jgi:hypothetical protein
MGADHGCDNFGTQPQPSENGFTGGIVANTCGGSPGASVGGQHGNQDIGRSTNSENDSIGVEWCDVRFETIVRKPPDAVRDILVGK